MNLAILHYHLNPGGVTRVIANHLLSLDATAANDGQRLRVMLLSDGQRGGWPTDLEGRLSSIDLTFHTIPSLAYQTQPSVQTERMADEINSALSAHGLGPDDTVLHAHNHSLGKNALYPSALRQLAERGYAMLLQPHDFAEDFRPANYRLLRDAFQANFSEQVYFQQSRVHYATLNRRDHNVLQRAGINEGRLHFLPNPVPDMDSRPARSDARGALERSLGISADSEYVLYPVRGIRRKNVGEMLLLSLLRNVQRRYAGVESPSVFAITLAPQNPAAIPYFKRWRWLAEELNLHCCFDVGNGSELTFEENLAAADRILTTSVAEGFGMVFLESWIAGRPLVGRDLPEITADFVEAGLKLDALYERLSVPLDWVGREEVIDAVLAACGPMYADFGSAVPGRETVAVAVGRQTVEGTVDFGSLDERLQESVIRRVAKNADESEALLKLNPTLAEWDTIDASLVAANQSVVQNQYSLHASGERLRIIYKALQEADRSAPQAAADADVLLQQFLDLNRFRLIRTS